MFLSPTAAGGSAAPERPTAAHRRTSTPTSTPGAAESAPAASAAPAGATPAASTIAAPVRACFTTPPPAALTTALNALAPVGVKGIIVAGILGAVMSSADTTLISASTILSLNVVSPFFSLDDAARLRLTRVFVLLLGLAAWGVASYRQEIIGSLLLAYTVFVGGVVVPTLASFWKERLGVTASAAFWSVVAGGSTALFAEVRSGAVLDATLGESGREVLTRLLGPEYASLLPLLVSVAFLFVISRLPSRVESDG